MLDILIGLERLSIFADSYKKITEYSPYSLSFLLFLLSFIVNLPLLFWYYVKNDVEFYEAALNLNDTNMFFYCGRTKFLNTSYGLVTSIISIFIRDILTLIVEIAITILSLVYLHRFIQNRIELTRPTRLNSLIQTLHANLNNSMIRNTKMAISLSILSIFLQFI